MFSLAETWPIQHVSVSKIANPLWGKNSCPLPLHTVTAREVRGTEPHLADDLPKRIVASFDPRCLISHTRHFYVQNLKNCRAAKMQIRK